MNIMSMKKHTAIAKIALGAFIFSAAVLVCGCVDIDKSYVAERLLWKADRMVSLLLQKATKEHRQLTYAEVDEMIAVYKKVGDRFPLEQNAARAHFSIADIYVRVEKFDDARKELARVIQNFSTAPLIASRAQVQIAQTFEREGKLNRAVEEYEKVRDLYPLTPLGLQVPLRIMQFYRQKDDEANVQKAYRQALRHYAEVLNQFAGTSTAGFYHSYIAIAHIEAREWERALEAWDAIIAAYPNTPFAVRAQISKAEIYVNNLNNVAKGIELYEDFMRQHPKGQGVESSLLKEVRLRLGGLYVASGRGEDAKHAFVSLLQEYPRDKEIGIRSHFGLASYYERAGNEQEFLREYETIKKLYRNDQRVLSIPFFIYRYYQRLNNADAARKVLEQAMTEYEAAFREHANDTQLSMLIARSLFFVYAQTKNWARLIGFLEHLQKKYPNDPSYPFSIASVYRNELKQPHEARRIYQEMLGRYAAHSNLVTLIQKQIDTLPQ